MDDNETLIGQTHDRIGAVKGEIDSQISAMRSEVGSQINTMKSEIDSLQIEVMGAKQSWRRDIPVVISILALMFSFGTTFVSYYRTNQQDINNIRSKLRNFIQRINDLPKENAKIMKEFRDDPTTAGGISSLINQENVLTAKLAAEAIKRIPSSVSSTEYLALVYALASSGLHNQALEFVKQGIDKVRDVNDEVGALRIYAGFLFASGDTLGGRVQYQQALDIFSKYPTNNRLFQYLLVGIMPRSIR